MDEVKSIEPVESFTGSIDLFLVKNHLINYPLVIDIKMEVYTCTGYH